MEFGQRINLQVQCRLCGNSGDHQFELFDSSSGEISSSLTKKIFRCLNIEVLSGDPTTVICGKCFNKLHGYDQFREVCHATNRKMKKSPSRPRKRTTESNRKSGFVTEPVNAYVSLVDSDSESEVAAYEVAISDISTPEIERSDGGSVAQIIELPESSAVFASTSSTLVKREYPENATISPKLEIESEQIAKSSTDACENEPTTEAVCDENDRKNIGNQRIVDILIGTDTKSGSDTDADAVHVSGENAPRKKRSSIPKVAIKKGRNVNKKSIINASRLPIKCSFGKGCRNSFENREAMKLHVESYHKNLAGRTFCCHMCKQSVANRRNMETHMNSSHTSVFRFMCPHRNCSKQFKTKTGLKIHINTMHKNQVAARCPKCPQTFFRENCMKKHLALEHGEGTAFVCHLCEESYTVEGSLKRHIKSIHTRASLYKCPEATCSKSFKNKSNMKKHFNGVHDQKTVYNCTDCSMTFNWKQSLHRHLSLKH